MNKLLLALIIILGVTTVVLAVAAFILGNLAILAPTGIESYPCPEYYVQDICYTNSIESDLASLYTGTSFITGFFAVLAALIYES